MIVLRAIGAFFAKIGRWIRDTAWVQPLLIVGGIFAIIFSIPYIINWVEGWFDVNEAVAYYNKFDLSIDGKNSKGDELISYLEKASRGEATEADKKKFGDKFFVTFVSETGDNADYYQAYEIFASESKKQNIKLDSGSFKLYTIYIDELDNEDKKCFNESSDNFFARHEVFFEHTQSLVDSHYAENYGRSAYEAALGNVADPDALSANTCFLVDFTDKAPEYTNKYGVSEIFFAVNGSDKYNKAYFLRDCWNHAGDFATK